jgi:hypothetical protein
MHPRSSYDYPVIVVRSLPKCRRLLYTFNFNSSLNIISEIFVPRSVHINLYGILAVPFVRSMGPNTRNVKDLKIRLKRHILTPRT